MDPSVKQEFKFEKASISSLNLFEKKRNKVIDAKVATTLETKANKILEAGSLSINLPNLPDSTSNKGDLIFIIEETAFYGRLRLFPQVTWELKEGELQLNNFCDKPPQEYFQAHKNSEYYEKVFNTLVELEEAGVLESSGKLLWGGKTKIVSVKKLQHVQGKTTNRILTTIQRKCALRNLFALSYYEINKINILKDNGKVGAINLKSETSLEEIVIQEDSLNRMLESYEGKVINSQYPGLENIQLREKQRKLEKKGKDRQFTVYEFKKV